MNAFWATVVLMTSVGLSLAMGVAASYWLVRLVLGAFGSRASMAAPVIAERARAAAAGH